MEQRIQSHALGSFDLDPEDPTDPVYTGIVTVPQHGSAEVNLIHDDGESGDWTSFVARSE